MLFFLHLKRTRVHQVRNAKATKGEANVPFELDNSIPVNNDIAGQRPAKR